MLVPIVEAAVSAGCLVLLWTKRNRRRSWGCALGFHDEERVRDLDEWAYVERCKRPGCGHEEIRTLAGG
jgi:hypothetical protein